MSKSNKSITTSSSCSVGDRYMNIGNDYKEVLNVQVTNQCSTIKDNRVSNLSSIEPISSKIITEWKTDLSM